MTTSSSVVGAWAVASRRPEGRSTSAAFVYVEPMSTQATGKLTGGPYRAGRGSLGDDVCLVVVRGA